MKKEQLSKLKGQIAMKGSKNYNTWQTQLKTAAVGLAKEWSSFQYKIDLHLRKRPIFLAPKKIGVSGIVTFFQLTDSIALLLEY